MLLFLLKNLCVEWNLADAAVRVERQGFCLTNDDLWKIAVPALEMTVTPVRNDREKHSTPRQTATEAGRPFRNKDIRFTKLLGPLASPTHCFRALEICTLSGTRRP